MTLFGLEKLINLIETGNYDEYVGQSSILILGP